MAISRSFRLQPVLTLKERREEQLQVDLAACQATEEELRQALERLRFEQRARTQQLGQLTSDGPLDLTSINAAHHYLNHVERRVEQQRVVTARARVATEETRGALTTAMQERKALEKLRERQREALRQHLRLLETTQAEETATSRFLRVQASAKGTPPPDVAS
jgi:flagellar export protein FliJ